MAGEQEFDLGELTASQQEALQQYTDVTSQEIKDAVSLLRRSEWNVHIAIAKFFDGEGPDLVADAAAVQDIPRAAPRHENLQESLLGAPDHLPHRPRTHRTDLAPRVVPQAPTTFRPPFPLALIFAPFRWGYEAVGAILRLAFYLLSYLPSPLRPRAVTESIRKGWRNTNGRKQLMPRDTMERFKREFEEEYGEHGLPWTEGGHAQAIDAAKKDVKFLLIILVSPEHDDSGAFIRDTLLSPEFISFVNDPAHNLLLWGGNVLDSEAFQVANEYMCTKYPFSCLVCLTPKEGSTRMGIIKRLVGPMAPAAYMSGLQGAMQKYGPDLDGVRAERAAQAVARSLRSEQDSAYERSLAIDRERARQRREAEAAATAAAKKVQEAAAAAKLREANRQQWRQWRATTIGPEPDAGAKDIVRLALNMPPSSGAGRVVRRFLGSTTFEDLYAFVECYDLVQDGVGSGEMARKPEDYRHKFAFQISSLMPRETFEPSETVTVGQKLGRGGNLIVEDILDEEAEDE